MQARDRNSEQCPRSLLPSPCVAGYCESIDMVLRRFSLRKSVSETAVLPDSDMLYYIYAEARNENKSWDLKGILSIVN